MSFYRTGSESFFSRRDGQFPFFSLFAALPNQGKSVIRRCCTARAKEKYNTDARTHQHHHHQTNESIKIACWFSFSNHGAHPSQGGNFSLATTSECGKPSFHTTQPNEDAVLWRGGRRSWWPLEELVRYTRKSTYRPNPRLSASLGRRTVRRKRPPLKGDGSLTGKVRLWPATLDNHFLRQRTWAQEEGRAKVCLFTFDERLLAFRVGIPFCGPVFLLLLLLLLPRSKRCRASFGVEDFEGVIYRLIFHPKDQRRHTNRRTNIENISFRQHHLLLLLFGCPFFWRQTVWPQTTRGQIICIPYDLTCLRPLFCSIFYQSYASSSFFVLLYFHHRKVQRNKKVAVSIKNSESERKDFSPFCGAHRILWRVFQLICWRWKRFSRPESPQPVALTGRSGKILWLPFRLRLKENKQYPISWAVFFSFLSLFPPSGIWFERLRMLFFLSFFFFSSVGVVLLEYQFPTGFPRSGTFVKRRWFVNKLLSCLRTCLAPGFGVMDLGSKNDSFGMERKQETEKKWALRSRNGKETRGNNFISCLFSHRPKKSELRRVSRQKFPSKPNWYWIWVARPPSLSNQLETFVVEVRCKIRNWSIKRHKKTALPHAKQDSAFLKRNPHSKENRPVMEQSKHKPCAGCRCRETWAWGRGWWKCCSIPFFRREKNIKTHGNI